MFYKSTLIFINDVRKDFGKSLCKSFRNDLVQSVTKTNRSEIYGGLRMFSFGDENQVSKIYLVNGDLASKEYVNSVEDLVFNHAPIIFVKAYRDTIKPRGFPGPNIPHCIFNLHQPIGLIKE